MMQTVPNSDTSVAAKSGKVPMPTRSLIALLCLAAVALASGCGRKPTELLTPYEAQLEARKAAEDEGRTAPTPEPPVEDRRFILDGLID